MPISRIPGVGLDSGSSGVAPSNLSTGGPYWDGSGNVGIGTSSPNIAGVSRALTVNTTNASSGAIYELAANGTNYAYLFANASNTVLSSVQSLPLLFNTNNTERARIASGGNVGISNTNPQSLLSVGAVSPGTAEATNKGSIQIQGTGGGSATGGGGLEFKSAASGNGYGFQISCPDLGNANVPLVFCARNDTATWTERARITSGGDFLVGTTTSSGRITSLSNLFDPTTSAKLTTTAMTTVGGYGGGISIIDGTQGYSLWSQAAGADFYIRRATTTGSYTGGVYISNAAGSWSAVSDERLKNIHRPIEDAADKLSGLRCVFGEYKDNPGIEHPFLIAQDVQVVFPEVVNEFDKENGYLGMSYTDMVPILVKAVQELNAKVEAQAAEIAALKGAA